MLQATADAMEAIHAAYWHPSDTEGRLIDPAGLVAQDSALPDAFDVSLGVEVFAGVNCTES